MKKPAKSRGISMPEIWKKSPNRLCKEQFHIVRFRAAKLCFSFYLLFGII